MTRNTSVVLLLSTTGILLGTIRSVQRNAPNEKGVMAWSKGGRKGVGASVLTPAVQTAQAVWQQVTPAHSVRTRSTPFFVAPDLAAVAQNDSSCSGGRGGAGITIGIPAYIILGRGRGRGAAPTHPWPLPETSCRELPPPPLHPQNQNGGGTLGSTWRSLRGRGGGNCHGGIVDRLLGTLHPRAALPTSDTPGRSALIGL